MTVITVLAAESCSMCVMISLGVGAVADTLMHTWPARLQDYVHADESGNCM